MLVARAAKTWARLPPCRAYSFGLMPSLKSSFPPEESSQPIEDASRQAEKWAQAGPSRVTIEDAEEKDMDMEARKKRRQTEWKRRQGSLQVFYADVFCASQRIVVSNSARPLGRYPFNHYILSVVS
ncbi:uncharacterized protein PHACADRAFT_172348 [Phanerochaete carnosa HHB-10118-sp]|uniref:Uncharacterized protein n=1 Tax=Phanerochaete carnosa (strain HHB-10118-sp) TaxID=650164 RepID=K5WCE6_PHACS|nr:uncharacterized protein PHACADRAFT_172348 [Phanerochaete carnosa HHB-10118-sp]EKM56679.1 hypothetical protein PHACADRAFT_172348 [Phanerochaete carnosa HHB-10118-sp]